MRSMITIIRQVISTITCFGGPAQCVSVWGMIMLMTSAEVRGEQAWSIEGDGGLFDPKTSLYIGANHIALVRGNGSLWGWGANWGGQLGVDKDDTQLVPTQLDAATDWSHVAIGLEHNMALKRDGSLWGIGDNSCGQLGDGTVIDGMSLRRIGADKTWVTVVAGDYHTLALDATRRLWGWGQNKIGQLGVTGAGDLVTVPSPVDDGSEWLMVAAGHEHSVGVQKDGSLWAWGSNDCGQLGSGTTNMIAKPTRIGIASDWLTVAAGYGHTLGLKRDGSLWAWGRNYSGQLGDGTSENRLTPKRIGDDSDWATIAVGSSHSLAIKRSGSLWAWGANYVGQVGDGTTENRSTPTRIGGDNDWASVVGGGGHTAAVKRNGGVWVCGAAIFGQLGNGVKTASYWDPPVRLGSEVGWTAVASWESADHIVALMQDGSMWAWGWNVYGQLGDGTKATRRVPTRVDTGTDWRAIAVGQAHSSALKADHSLWTWGKNDYGQLGNGTLTGSSEPLMIGQVGDWSYVSTGSEHSVGIRQDGSLWSWGRNDSGQLGDGTRSHRSVPTLIDSGAKWRSVSAGEDHTVAIMNDGSLWAWGWNKDGRLGDGTAEDRLRPVRIGSDNDWRICEARSGYTQGVKENGTLWSWGWCFMTPTQVGNDGNWAFVMRYAARTDGSLWWYGCPTWNGQPRYELHQSDKEGFWIGIAEAYSAGAGIQQDGSLWAWGYSQYGMVGNGTAFREVFGEVLPPERDNPFTLSIARDGPSTRIVWHSSVGRTYQVQSSRDLDDWQDSGPAMSGDGGLKEIVVESDGSQAAFFRVKAH